ncbi:MAG TPA: cupredoxin domain-containing protein [Actinomycetota bacterium]
MRSIPMRVAVLFAVLAVFGAACSSKSNSSSGGSPSPSESVSASASASASESAGGTITVGSDTANNHGSKEVDNITSVEVEMDDFYFGPTVLTGSPGQKLTIELKNESKAGTLHNFTLSDQNIDQDVQADQSTEVTVTFPQSGFLEFFCKYHKSSGMVGELTTS